MELTIVVALVFELRDAVGFTFVLGLTPKLETGFWLRLGEVLKLMLVLRCELGIEVDSK